MNATRVTSPTEEIKPGADTVVFLNGIPSVSFLSLGQTSTMIMGCGFCCHVNSPPVLYLLPLVTGWFSFLPQARWGPSRWSPDMVIDQQQSGRDRRSGQNTQPLRHTTHAHTHAHAYTPPKNIPRNKQRLFILTLKSGLKMTKEILPEGMRSFVSSTVSLVQMTTCWHKAE